MKIELSIIEMSAKRFGVRVANFKREVGSRCTRLSGIRVHGCRARGIPCGIFNVEGSRRRGVLIDVGTTSRAIPNGKSSRMTYAGRAQKRTLRSAGRVNAGQRDGDTRLEVGGLPKVLSRTQYSKSKHPRRGTAEILLSGSFLR